MSALASSLPQYLASHPVTRGAEDHEYQYTNSSDASARYLMEAVNRKSGEEMSEDEYPGCNVGEPQTPIILPIRSFEREIYLNYLPMQIKYGNPLSPRQVEKARQVLSEVNAVERSTKYRKLIRKLDQWEDYEAGKASINAEARKLHENACAALKALPLGDACRSSEVHARLEKPNIDPTAEQWAYDLMATMAHLVARCQEKFDKRRGPYPFIGNLQRQVRQYQLKKMAEKFDQSRTWTYSDGPYTIKMRAQYIEFQDDQVFLRTTCQDREKSLLNKHILLFSDEDKEYVQTRTSTPLPTPISPPLSPRMWTYARKHDPMQFEAQLMLIRGSDVYLRQTAPGKGILRRVVGNFVEEDRWYMSQVEPYEALQGEMAVASGAQMVISKMKLHVVKVLKMDVDWREMDANGGLLTPSTASCPSWPVANTTLDKHQEERTGDEYHENSGKGDDSTDGKAEDGDKDDVSTAEQDDSDRLRGANDVNYNESWWETEDESDNGSANDDCTTEDEGNDLGNILGEPKDPNNTGVEDSNVGNGSDQGDAESYCTAESVAIDANYESTEDSHGLESASEEAAESEVDETSGEVDQSDGNDADDEKMESEDADDSDGILGLGAPGVSEAPEEATSPCLCTDTKASKDATERSGSPNSADAAIQKAAGRASELEEFQRPQDLTGFAYVNRRISMERSLSGTTFGGDPAMDDHSVGKRCAIEKQVHPAAGEEDADGDGNAPPLVVDAEADLLQRTISAVEDGDWDKLETSPSSGSEQWSVLSEGNALVDDAQ